MGVYLDVYVDVSPTEEVLKRFVDKLNGYKLQYIKKYLSLPPKKEVPASLKLEAYDSEDAVQNYTWNIGKENDRVEISSKPSGSGVAIETHKKVTELVISIKWSRFLENADERELVRRCVLETLNELGGKRALYVSEQREVCFLGDDGLDFDQIITELEKEIGKPPKKIAELSELDEEAYYIDEFEDMD